MVSPQGGLLPVLLFLKPLRIMKKYIAKSHVAVCVTFANGSHKHINFFPKTTGGSVYYTDNKDEQDALEAHPKFGKLYKVDNEFNETVAAQPANAPSPAVSGEEGQNPANGADKGDTLITITVTDLNSAKDYLCDKFGLSRTKLKSKTSIINAARENGVVFSGI